MSQVKSQDIFNSGTLRDTYVSNAVSRGPQSCVSGGTGLPVCFVGIYGMGALSSEAFTNQL